MNRDLIKKIKINGRFLFKNNNLYLFHVGSGISFLFKGKSFKLEGDFIDKKGFIYIIIDRDYEHKEKVLLCNKNFEYKFNKVEEHLIDIIKANEEQDNTLVIKDLILDGKFSKFNHKYSHKIRVYGDSTIAGYGILKKGGNDASIFVNDGVEDFCFKCLYKMNAEMDIFAASGWGLSFSEYTVPKNVGIIDKFENISLIFNDKYKNESKYDLLIISLGTNDFSYIESNQNDAAKLSEKFIQNYLKIISAERKKNPKIPVFMVYGTLNEEKVYKLIEKTYEEICKKNNNVFLYKFSGDNSGVSNHAFVSFHNSMAEELNTLVKQILH